MAAGTGGIASMSEKAGSDQGSDESSESEGETKAFHRRISTSKAIKNGVCIKEGTLMKQTSSFQRWKRRYFRLKPRRLYYAKDRKSVIFEEIDLTDLSIAECSTKNVNHSFQLITPFRRLVLCADSRKEMEEWISALKNVSSKEFYEGADQHDFLSGQHNWYVTSHARPTYCNVCREALSGVTSHGLSCEVCKFKVHKRCAIRAPNNCKWTTLSSVGKDSIIEDEDGSIAMPHQWLEGNLPVSAKCVVCDKTCGSVLRLQDWRCLWCRAMVHTSCKPLYSIRCPLGICRVSIVPPTVLHSIGSDEAWEALRPMGCSPLLVFVNSKSGDNQGVKFLRRFKQLLNPAQVFDLINGGPALGLRMFQTFNPFRILVCGGDGSVSWVLTEIDNLKMHKQCQVGVLPLGTGNDLARVLGWGSVCDDDTQLPQLLEKYEKSTIKLLDRWSIMIYEGTMPTARRLTSQQYDPMTVYEDSIVAHLTKILHSDQHSVVISSAKVLCETVKEIIAKVGAAYASEESAEDKDSISYKCTILNEKLGSLLQALNEESLASTEEMMVTLETEKDTEIETMDTNRQEDISLEEETSKKKDTFIQREALMSRANSLKKAVRKIIEHTERAVDEQNAQTKQRQATQIENQTVKPWNRTDLLAGSSLNKSENVELPVFKTTFHDEDRPPPQPPPLQCWNPWGTSMGQSVGAPLKDTLQVTLPTIEGGTSADSSPCPSPKPYLSLSTTPILSPLPSPVPSPQRQTPESPSPPEQPGELIQSPTASRRISSGSTLKHVGHGLHFGAAGFGVPLVPPLPRETSRSPETVPIECREFPIINPLASLPMWPNLNKDSLIGKVLLANADALCAAASPLMDVEEMSLEGFEEKCVMNNYFGIGLDAKITLEFHNKREEHPEKCRSRTKNLMWYGVLGGKELLQRTFKNLEQRVHLECDGRRIPLPSLQGIVVLNIASYGGGSNFWGGTKEDDVFYAPTFDDKILEVVAVFGTVQMAASRVINLQHHRIAQVLDSYGNMQCRSVKITIMGDEGVPVQVDGEAWVQSPGYICIVHKNRTQVLCRNRHLESTLKTWQDKQRSMVPSRTIQLMPLLDEEILLITEFVEMSSSLVRMVKMASISHPLIEQELFMLASRTACCVDALFPSGRLTEGPHVRQHLTELVANVRQLYQETSTFLRERTEEVHIRPDIEEQLSNALSQAELELKRCMETQGIVHFQAEEGQEQKRHHRGLFKLKFKKQAKSNKNNTSQRDKPGGSCDGSGCGTPIEGMSHSYVLNWSTEEVATWLESIQMTEYKENFIRHDIRGSELLNLERRDLKELGITKVGHIKRLLQAIRDITSNATERKLNTH